MDSEKTPRDTRPRDVRDVTAHQIKALRSWGVKEFLWRALLFVLVGLVLYSGVYAYSESLVYKHTELNRFFKVKTAEASTYDYVFVGSSQTAVFDLQDMNAQLEQITGKKIMNLGSPGAGPYFWRTILDYFLARHQTRAVVFFTTPAMFYSEQWNETKLKDVGLYQRAPFDPSLVKVLVQNPTTRWMGLDYLFGFSKNNFWVTESVNRTMLYKSDISDFPQAGRFTRVWRPLKQVDDARIMYLYGSIQTTGKHNGEANAASLTDTTKNFSSLGVKVGDTLFNTTDGSSIKKITAITTTTKPNDTLVGVLTGGAKNVWNPGDAYLYEGTAVDQELFQRYDGVFEDMVRSLQEQGVRVILIRLPLRPYVYDMIPNAAWFEGQVKSEAEKLGVELYDFSKSIPDPENKLYMDTDHLNQAGMTFFAENFLKTVLTVPAS